MAEADPTVPRARQLRPMDVVVGLLLVGVVLLPFFLIGAGGWLIFQREHGTRTSVEVTGCDLRVSGRGYAEYCEGSWTVHGHQVIDGEIDGASSSDVGHTIGATVRGDTAYSRSLGLPLLLIGLGVPFLIMPTLWARKAVRKVRARRAAG